MSRYFPKRDNVEYVDKFDGKWVFRAISAKERNGVADKFTKVVQDEYGGNKVVQDTAAMIDELVSLSIVSVPQELVAEAMERGLEWENRMVGHLAPDVYDIIFEQVRGFVERGGRRGESKPQ